MPATRTARPKAAVGGFDSAIAACNRAIKIDPKKALAYDNRANDRMRKGG